VLAGFAWGSWERNKVWRTEESLWYDVTVKSPRNGRGLMNYGLTLMAKDDYPRALGYFQRPAIYTPNYYVLEVNLGIVRRPA
jgi:protein O-mannosyl-transferase